MIYKILVIEDDNSVRENIDVLLAEEGYKVFSAGNGKDGLKIARQELPHLIICDIMMQGIDGYQVLKELSTDAETRTIPFIFLTAKVEKNDIRKGMNLGADDYLFKPFDADDLLAAIASRLKRIEVLQADFQPEANSSGSKKYNMDDKLFVQINNKTIPLNISDIAAINAERQYTTIIASDGKSYLLRKSIAKWEESLPEKKFLRIHRSTIINIDYLVKMETWFNSGFLVYLKNIDKPFVISRRYSTKLREKLLK